MNAIVLLVLGISLIIIMETAQLSVYLTKLNRLRAQHEKEKKELRDKCHERIEYWHKKYNDEKEK